jgi:ABC-type nitrate/sulfonate/bicarbonate transport system substrate-binding protein
MTAMGNGVRVRVSVFPGGFNWPLFVGRQKGFFARRDLDVEVQATAGSVQQMSDFATGRFEIAMTGFDNIVAYVEGDGEAPIGAQPDFFAFLGSDDSFLSIVASPGIEDAAHLRGKEIAVDAATTGYAFVLYELLARAGLHAGDYRVAKVGGMAQRWEDLRRGLHPATLLSAPYDLLAQNEGFRILARVREVLGSYQGNVAAARRSWAAGNPDAVVSYIRSYIEAVKWLYEPSHMDEACDILLANVPGIPAALAPASYTLLLDPVTGFFSDAGIRPDGVRSVLDLRSRYSPSRRPLRDPRKYVDLSYWEAARERN